jgi:predicted ArsR family transcriptional regulator
VVRRERESEQRYREALAGSRSLRERLTRLAELRSREGYMASVVREARGRYLLVEDHCPVCAAARACQGFCRAELEVFRRVLDADVERTEYLLEGARRCAYRVCAPHSG